MSIYHCVFSYILGLHVLEYAGQNHVLRLSDNYFTCFASMFFANIDLSHIPVNKGTNSRLWWTKYSDLYEIFHPSLSLFLYVCSLERNAVKVY